MRRVAYWLLNKAFEASILEFCESEGLLAVDLAAQQDLSGNYVFFITDDKTLIEEKCAELNTPCCLISNDIRSSMKYLVISNTFGIFTLRMLLDYIHHGSSLWNSSAELEMQSLTREYYVNNNIHDLERIVYQMTWELMYFCVFSDIEKIRIGFSEMLINAIEHGNLAISNSEKFQSTESGKFYELLDERMKDPVYGARRAHVRMDFTPETVKITITDEGKGFDTSSLPNPQNPEDLLKLHGRGIIITKAYFDSVSYNEKGNEVTLFKTF